MAEADGEGEAYGAAVEALHKTLADFDAAGDSELGVLAAELDQLRQMG